MDLNGKSESHALSIWKVLLALLQRTMIRAFTKPLMKQISRYKLEKHPIFGVSLRANGFEKSKRKIPYAINLNFHWRIWLEWMKRERFFFLPILLKPK